MPLKKKELKLTKIRELFPCYLHPYFKIPKLFVFKRSVHSDLRALKGVKEECRFCSLYVNIIVKFQLRLLAQLTVTFSLLLKTKL